MKRWIAFFLLAALLVSALPALADERSDELYKAIKGTTVKIHFCNEPTALDKKMIKAFELKYRCKVEPFVMTWNDWKNQILTLVVAGNVPDVTSVPDEPYLKWLSNGLLQPLDDYVIADDPIWNSQIWDMTAWEGKHYGVSDGGISPIYVIYNATLFYEKGVKNPMEYYEEGKWNFKNFRKCAIEMTGDGIVGCGTDWKYTFALANGNPIVELDRENGELNLVLNEENAVTGMELYVELYQGGYFMQGACAMPFANGELAMFLERPGLMVGGYDMRNTTLQNAEIEYVPMPVGPENDEGLAPCIIGFWSVPTKAQNPLGGMAWAYFVAEYNEKHKDDEDVVEGRRKTYTDEQYEFIREYEENTTFINTFVYGVGDWYQGDWGYAADMIFNGFTPQAAYEKWESQFQFWIDGMFIE